MMHYAGIGSRQTPAEACVTCHLLAMNLASRGWTLRSGGADGADRAFEVGAWTGAKEIFLPWRGFNSNSSPLHHVSEDAIELSLQYHPTPERISGGVRKIMGRNAYQVLGLDLRTPCQFVVCWTPFPTEFAFDPTKRIGGTGQAIRIARAYGIPVYNLRDAGALEKLGADLPCLESSVPSPNKTP